VARLSDLRGRRLTILENARMCIAQAWLSTLLAEEHLGAAGQFFGSIAADSKPARVVLPVFFGQADVCLASKRTFDTMSELNPQVARELAPLAGSPPLVVTFYTFHRNCHGGERDRFAQVYASLPASAAGQQLATLFQFEKLAVRDAACLAPALAILETADRLRRGREGGMRK
jgi:hypothetical protein